MNQEIKNYVMQKMSPFLDNGQTLRLERILEEVQLKQEKRMVVIMKKIMLKKIMLNFLRNSLLQRGWKVVQMVF